MAFISSKFNIPAKSGTGFTAQGWADNYLLTLATAFTTASAAWSIESQIETIGTNTNTAQGCRTLQLVSSASGKHLRIWCFSYSASATASESESASGGATSLKMYYGNLLRCSSASMMFGDQSGYGELYFGVSDTSIGADFGYDLDLSVPIFGLANYEKNSTSIALANNDGAYANGATVSVITDGKFFGVMRMLTGASTIAACFYAPDMISCANLTDQNTEGVISCEQIGDNFYFGTNTLDSATSTVTVLYNAADGTRDFRGWTLGINNGKDACMAVSTSTEIPCTALKVFLILSNYTGSNQTGIVNGLNFKGWINPAYMRSANVTVLPVGSKGMSFGNGNWFCTDAGTLICWDPSNPSPFDATL